ncbi:hypothetical protein [Nonlabens sp.]|uniref:hypothetical protein n=1 Tax=Nonlabens sp. TaxID=1888209 RepID=UPI0032646180
MKNNNQHTQAGFKVPEGYFDSLTDRVLENTQKDEIVEHAGFSVPKDYFSTLEDRILKEVQEDEKEVKVVTLQTSKNNTWLYPLLAMAAVFIGFVTINSLFSKDEVTFADLNDQELRDYIVDVNFLQDEESVEILYADNSILNDTEIEQEFTDNELLDYLMEDTTLDQIIRE